MISSFSNSRLLSCPGGIAGTGPFEKSTGNRGNWMGKDVSMYRLTTGQLLTDI